MLSKLSMISLLSSVLCAGAGAIPKNVFDISSLSSRAVQAADQVLAIAPKSSSCAVSTGECRTAEQAASALINAFLKYSIYNMNEVSMVLSLIAFESVDFQFKTNQVPGRPGQGTSNMQMASFNLMYANSIPELAPKVAAITTAKDVTGLSNDQLNAIRALVIPDEYNFASGMWFLTTQCASSRAAMQAGGSAGFAAYMSCVGTPVTDDRTAYFVRAQKAFGTSS